ncbi:hypothetical protein THAOC_34930 [Thalassiosira oceanica]|uniref:Uncharacterized protein n=1 Tax=Thalassiosira oceanica TaxID=159749 RepID=K0R2N2_THAOC|nr:hypothetical protein THAOC_34930 [Thalassiosira oceanica]|eukprot:EJK46395.1 hypothetical protein THAOC_34930 [Thalassiosira oceanica]
MTLVIICVSSGYSHIHTHWCATPTLLYSLTLVCLYWTGPLQPAYTQLLYSTAGWMPLRSINICTHIQHKLFCQHSPGAIGVAVEDLLIQPSYLASVVMLQYWGELGWPIA